MSMLHKQKKYHLVFVTETSDFCKNFHILDTTYAMRFFIQNLNYNWILLCSDPEVVIVGFSWDGSDERKMLASFDFGRRSFGRFVDLATVAEGLGYQQTGLASLTHRVLGAHLPKLRSVRHPPVCPVSCSLQNSRHQG